MNRKDAKSTMDAKKGNDSYLSLLFVLFASFASLRFSPVSDSPFPRGEGGWGVRANNVS